MRAWSWQKKGILWGLCFWAFGLAFKYVFFGTKEEPMGLLVGLLMWLLAGMFFAHNTEQHKKKQ